MSKYTDSLTAEQLIHYIATDYYELSYDKIRSQRDEWMKNCRDWLAKNGTEATGGRTDPVSDDF
jgi:hypothetical protein